MTMIMQETSETSISPVKGYMLSKQTHNDWGTERLNPHLQQTEAHYSFKALCYLRDKDTCTSRAEALCGRYSVAIKEFKPFNNGEWHTINGVQTTVNQHRKSDLILLFYVGFFLDKGVKGKLAYKIRLLNFDLVTLIHWWRDELQVKLQLLVSVSIILPF